MIIDAVANLGQYTGVHHRFQQAIDFLNQNDVRQLEPGKYEIDGSHLFAIVQEYETKPQTPDSIWEAHQKYHDIQIVVSGIEAIGHAPIEQSEVKTPYSAEKDVALFSTNAGNVFTLREGYFAFFAPHDVHMPCTAVGGQPSPVKKVVIKVEI